MRHRAKRVTWQTPVFKLAVKTAEQNWLRLNGRNQLSKFVSGIKCIAGNEGVHKNIGNTQNAAWATSLQKKEYIECMRFRNRQVNYKKQRKETYL